MNPRDPAQGGPQPAIVTDLRAQIGDRHISLSWDVNDASNVGQYYIYRREADQPEATLTDSTSALEYEDVGLTNGLPYLYQVSAVLRNRLEGKRSSRVEAVPGVYGVLIESGAEVTASRQVNVTLSAPSGTASVRIGDTPALDGTTAQTYSPAKVWTLPADDGEYTVYARFTSSGGNTSALYEDSIRLETNAAAVTLAEPTAVSRTELTLSWSRNNDQDFASYAVYRSSQPSVDLTDELLSTITSADVTTYRDNGLRENTRYYYRIFVSDSSIHSTPSNEVGVRTANAPPTAVVLAGNAGAVPDEIDLSWSMNQDHDFSQYRIYRDTSPAVGTTATLVRTITDRASLACIEFGLQDNTKYYYRVFVADTGDSLTSSNEIMVRTANAPPPPVTLSLVDTTATSASLAWTQSMAADFASYKLYMSASPGVSTSGAPYATITQENLLNAVVTGLNRRPSGTTPGQDYFFVTVVEDLAGGRTPSNELRVRGMTH